MYYVRWAIFGVVIGLLVFILTEPTKSQTFAKQQQLEVMHTSKMEHDWTLQILGRGGTPVMCMLESSWDNDPATSQSEVPAGNIGMIISASSQVPDGNYGFEIWSRQWKLAKTTEPYKVDVAFGDANDKIVVKGELALRTSDDSKNGMMAFLTHLFLDDFAKYTTLSVRVDDKFVGAFPLIGSANAVRTLRSCEEALGRKVIKEGGAEGTF